MGGGARNARKNGLPLRLSGERETASGTGVLAAAHLLVDQGIPVEYG
jgi:hypothetical protein